MRDKRKRSGRKYPRRKLWIERRDAAFARAGDYCEVTGEKLYELVGEANLGTGQIVAGQQWHRACDHLLPERWVRRFCKAADPHVLENLIVITRSLHAKKTAMEYLAFQADYLGYKRELNRLGFAPELFDRALQAIVGSVK